jgi:hypothetical protein
MPGSASENALAASITPAPKPNMVSCVRWAMSRANTAGKVPAAVAPAATQPPRKASSTGDMAGFTGHRRRRWTQARTTGSGVDIDVRQACRFTGSTWPQGWRACGAGNRRGVNAGTAKAQGSALTTIR